MKNRGDLYDATATGKASLQAIRNLDLSAWTHYAFNGYPGYRFEGYMQEILMYDNDTVDQTDSITFTSIERKIGQQYLGWDYSSFSTAFDGVADYVDCGTDLNSSLELGDSFSFSAWVKFSTDTTHRTIMANLTTTPKGVQLRVLNTEAIRFIILQSGGIYRYVDSSVLAVDTWHHVVATYDGSNTEAGLNMYINGSLDNSSKFSENTITSITSTDSFKIGKYGTSSHMYEGNIDEVSIFNSELTLAQVESIYNDGLPADLTDLSPTAWWRMGDESGWPLLTNKMAYSKYSLEFDGVDDYVDCGDVPPLNSVAEFSVSMWVKKEGDGYIFSKYIDNSNRIHIAIIGSTIYFQMANAGGAYGTAAYTGGSDWTHIAMVYDGANSGDNDTTLKGYENGSPLTLGWTGTVGATTADLAGIPVILGEQNTANYYEGNLDEVAIWDIALTSGNITTIYNSGVPNDISSLNPVAYYKVDGSVYPNIDNAMAYSKKSLLFDGVTDRVNMGNVLDQTGLAGSDFSISAWVKIEDITTFNYIFSKAKKSANYTGYHFYIRPTTGYLTFYVSGQNASEVTDRRTTTNGVVEGEWAHVVVTYTFSTDASGITFYTNGELTTSSVTSSDFTALDTATNSYDCLIGAREDTGLPMDGYIDDVSFFDSVLSLSDVQTIYNNGKPADISALSPLGLVEDG